MGTFHDTKDPLHGITVVVHAGDTVHVGRCHERTEANILLLDADSHTEDETGRGADGKSNSEYLDRTAKFGVWVKEERLLLPTAQVEKIIPLSQYFRRPGEKMASQDAVTTETPAIQLDEPKPLAESSSSIEHAVSVTEAASKEIRRLLALEEKPGQALRLAVSGGGCSGMVYKVEFDQEQEGDLVIPYDDFQVLLDRKSTIYLRGITLDHDNGLGGKGFQFHNPNASNTCGCGESFSV